MDLIPNIINSEEFTQAINSEIFIAIIGVFLTAFVTYYVNKLASLSPKKQELFNKRLDTVLLPLQKHFTYTKIKFDNHRIHISKINYIYKNHMIYTSTNMQSLVTKLNMYVSMEITDKDKLIQKLLNAIQAQTNYEYELVRNKLRLPSKKIRFDEFLFASILRNTFSFDALIDWFASLLLTSFGFFFTTIILYKYFFHLDTTATTIVMVILSLEILSFLVISVAVILVLIIKFLSFLYNIYKLYKKATKHKKQ